MKTIKRVIFANNIEEVDFNNIGVHFTENLGYNHKGGGSNGCTVEKEYKVTFFLKDYVVNDEATKISNEGYPNEKEVVLEFNKVCMADVHIQKSTPFGGYGRPEKTRREVNIGERCDIWVSNL